MFSVSSLDGHGHCSYTFHFANVFFFPYLSIRSASCPSGESKCLYFRDSLNCLVRWHFSCLWKSVDITWSSQRESLSSRPSERSTSCQGKKARYDVSPDDLMHVWNMKGLHQSRWNSTHTHVRVLRPLRFIPSNIWLLLYNAAFKCQVQA